MLFEEVRCGIVARTAGVRRGVREWLLLGDEDRPSAGLSPFVSLCRAGERRVVPSPRELLKPAGWISTASLAFRGKSSWSRRWSRGWRWLTRRPFFLNGRWYFFTTTVQPFMETLLFWADRLDGAWNLHPCSPISGSVRNSRSAGNLFWRNGRLYRPTQDCSVRYGYAIQVNESHPADADRVRGAPGELDSAAWSPGLLGTHTWNESSRLEVLDGIRLQAAPVSPAVVLR